MNFNTKQALESFIGMCDELMIPAEEASFNYKDFFFNGEEDDPSIIEYLQTIAKNWKVIEKSINDASMKAYTTFKNNFQSEESNYQKMRKKECAKFYKDNKRPPKVWKVERECEYVDVLLDTNANGDFILFYQEEVFKYLKQDEKIKSLGISFSIEDYPSIYIHVKKSKEALESFMNKNDQIAFPVEESFFSDHTSNSKSLKDFKKSLLNGDKTASQKIISYGHETEVSYSNSQDTDIKFRREVIRIVSFLLSSYSGKGSGGYKYGKMNYSDEEKRGLKNKIKMNASIRKTLWVTSITVSGNGNNASYSISIHDNRNKKDTKVTKSHYQLLDMIMKLNTSAASFMVGPLIYIPHIDY